MVQEAIKLVTMAIATCWTGPIESASPIETKLMIKPNIKIDILLIKYFILLSPKNIIYVTSIFNSIST